MTLPIALPRVAAAWLLAVPALAVPALAVPALAVPALAVSAPPLAAQPPAADTSARPPRIPPRGPVPREPAVERRLQTDVKAPDGFSVTLFAGPPVAMYPTCVGESPDGALFVCVDPNLSLSTYKNVGRVMRLVDDDRDGRADRYTTFAQMDSPRGVATDGRTVYVMHPPSLTAYRDTTGDGIADEARDIVTGLGFDLDFRGADHTTNNVALGADGWLYVAVGDYGFIKAVGSDGTQLQHRGGAVVRVRPDGTNLELYATGTRNIYDVALDPFMRAFARDNTNDGDGWDTRLHYIAQGADMGYPARYQNFPAEHFPSIKDYGAGAGVGSVWVQDPALPAGYNNTLYTGDWTLNKIFRHPLTPKGAIFEAGQDEFLTVVRPADLVADAQSNLYVASLAGGQFTYNTDTVGYVFRVNYGGAAPARAAAAPAALARQTDAQLVAALATANAVARVHASQELVRRGARTAVVAGLRQLALDARQPAESRAAALFTLKQVAGAGSHPTLQQAAADADPRVRAVALRALADRRDQLDGVPAALYVRALGDPDAHVQTQAITGLVRLGARTSADALVPLAGSPDQAIAHLAVNALAALGARDAALRAVDAGAPAARAGALRALAMMHDQATADALVARAARVTDPAARRPLLVALARLHNREGYWAGDWWTTKPAHLGPYFDPAAWEASPQIRRALATALTAATGADCDTLAADLVRNQVLPRGAAPLLAALTAARDPQRSEVITAMVGRSQLDPSAVALVAALDARRPALHGAVARLLAGESTVAAGGAPLVRAAALDTALDADVRAQLLGTLAQVPGPAGLDAAAEVFARLNPEPGAPATATGAAAAAAAPTPPAGSAPAVGGSAGTGTGTSAGLGNGTTNASANAGANPGTGAGANPTASGNAAARTPAGAAGGDAVAAAWRRFVGDRRRAQEIDYFVAMTRADDPSQRTLAYAVLVQAVRTPRAPAAVRAKVAPVLDAAWSDPRSAPSLVRAITLMRVEGQYRERLDAYQARGGR